MQPSSFTAGPVNQVLWETKQVWQNILYIHTRTWYVLAGHRAYNTFYRMLIPGALLWTSNTTTTAIVYPTERSCHLVHITVFVCSTSYAPWYAPCSHGEQQSHAWFCINPPYFAIFSQDVPLDAHSWYITRKTLHGGTEQSMHDRRVVPRTNHGARHYVSHRIQTEPPFLSAVSFLTKQLKNELLIARNSRNCDPREAENISGTPPRVVTLIPTRFGSIFSLYGAKII